MLPRLQAEEQIAGVRTAALGGGLYPAEDQERLLAVLDSRAAGGEPRRAKKARPDDLAAMGIGVAMMPASAPPEKGLSDG